ncbi:hypothetical protein D3C78_1844010 [compost metagenome]
MFKAKGSIQLQKKSVAHDKTDRPVSFIAYDDALGFRIRQYDLFDLAAGLRSVYARRWL